MSEKDPYLGFVDRLEPDIEGIGVGLNFLTSASIAVSLKRIADALDNTLFADRIQDAIYNAMVNAERRR